MTVATLAHFWQNGQNGMLPTTFAEATAVRMWECCQFSIGHCQLVIVNWTLATLDIGNIPKGLRPDYLAIVAVAADHVFAVGEEVVNKAVERRIVG